MPCNGVGLPSQQCVGGFGPEVGHCSPMIPCHDSSECENGFSCVFPTATASPTRTPTITNTVPFTLTPTRTPTQTNTPTVTPTGVGCCHFSGFGCRKPPPYCSDNGGLGETLADCGIEAFNFGCVVEYFTVNALCTSDNDCPTPLPTPTPTITNTPTVTPTCVPSGELCTDPANCCDAPPCILFGDSVVCSAAGTRTPSVTPTPTLTPTNTGTPTPILGDACCQCSGPSCIAPVNGTCGDCVPHPGFVCSGTSCVTPTPLPIGSCCQSDGLCTDPSLGFCPIGFAGVPNAICEQGSCVTPIPTPS